MGAVTFSLDMRLVQCLKQVLPLSLFVETGTFNGDTTGNVIPFFDRIISIELSDQLWKAACERFIEETKVKLYLGKSASVLATLRENISTESTLYWLDAHWCVAENSAGQLSQCPLLEEIRAIRTLNESSVLIVDDARLFLAPPPKPHDATHWPLLDEVITALRQLSKEHEVMVVNDVILFFPKPIRAHLVEFAQSYGVDWLLVAPYLDPHNNLFEVLKDKEQVIQSQHSLLQEQSREIQDKDRLLDEHRVFFRVFGPIWRICLKAILPIYKFIRPRIGVLRQESPCELVMPKEYYASFSLASPPKISIVTPSFNQCDFIEKTINSVLDQNYPNLEYYIQDGGSKDGTLDTLERYSGRINGWSSNSDNGQANAINLAFAKTSGDIMGWLNSDDILLPGALAYVANYFSHNPDIDVVYGHRVIIDAEDKQVGRWMMPAHDNDVLSWADYIPQETMFWRRRIWEKIGSQVDESYYFAMDWDLIVRFRDAGAQFSRLPRFLGGFRVHGSQKTTADMASIGQEEMNRIRLKCLGRVPTRFEMHKALTSYFIRHILTDINWRVYKKIAKSCASI